MWCVDLNPDDGLVELNYDLVEVSQFHKVQVIACAYSLLGRADRKSRQCLGFCTSAFWSLLDYKSAEQKPKHCLT